MANLNRRQSALALAAGWAAPATWAAEQVPDAAPAARLRALAEHFFDQLLDAYPTWASQLGMATPAQAARLGISIAPSHIAAKRALQRKTQAELARIDRGALSGDDLIAYDTLDFALRDGLAEAAFPAHLLPLNHMGSTLLALALARENGLSAFDTPLAYEQHLQRLRQLPQWCDQAISNLRQGVRQGVVQPRVIILRLLPALRTLAEPDPGKSLFCSPLRPLPTGWPQAERQRITRAYAQVLHQSLLPAVKRLLHLVERDYLAAGRASSGWGGLPNGAAWYAQQVKSSTSTDMSPDQIHALGLQEVVRLTRLRAEVQAQFGFQGDAAAFLAWHHQRPEVRPFRTEAEVLQAYQRLNERIAPQLPSLFGRTPKAPLQILPEPALTRDTASDHYLEPSPDGTRPGTFFAVVNDPAQYAVTGMATLFLHEGQPGHHYQIALAQELPLTRLQRFSGFDAYVEGWALYAETLGYPLGLFDDPTAHLGHLSDALLRACRLVVDTGMHAQGWSRERAMDYLRQHIGYDEALARNQIVRYMVWPGQALSYTVGRVTIERLRDQARAALGPRFSLPDFHDQVLASGALPLAVLEAKIARYIQANRPA